MNKTVFQIAKDNNINKVCIDGVIKDIRQLDESSFNIIPSHTEIMKDTIYNEPILFCY